MSAHNRANALLVIPPFLKHIGGPLAGPAYLAGAGRSAGHSVEVLDLNDRWIGPRLKAQDMTGKFIGDHDKPSDELNRISEDWQALCILAWPRKVDAVEITDLTVHMKAPIEEVDVAAANLAAGGLGNWLRAELGIGEVPDIVGVSVMFGGQVLAALAVSMVVRALWPKSWIVWGGAHVTALEDEIGSDPTYGRHCDGFVVGYAEQTWVELLDAVANRSPWPGEVVPAGRMQKRAKSKNDVTPYFRRERRLTPRLTLPLQSSRGCFYGKCAFCTYPTIEGARSVLSRSAIETVVTRAEIEGAVVSFKDSLIRPKELEELASLIAGRVQWSACTKLHLALNAAALTRLHAGGCRTIEIGLETLAPEMQQLIGKPQSLPLFGGFLDAAATAGVAVVINYITGIPNADAAVECGWLKFVRAEIARRPKLIAKVEHNVFQLERRAPMGRAPEKYGLKVIQSWPWSSLLEYQKMPSDLK